VPTVSSCRRRTQDGSIFVRQKAELDWPPGVRRRIVATPDFIKLAGEASEAFSRCAYASTMTHTEEQGVRTAYTDRYMKPRAYSAAATMRSVSWRGDQPRPFDGFGEAA